VLIARGQSRRAGGDEKTPTMGVWAHFEIAVGVEQQVGWLQVAVQDVGRVERLECSEGL
jgi:hypothetical protein